MVLMVYPAGGCKLHVFTLLLNFLSYYEAK